MSLCDKSLQYFADALSSKEPTPGGGGASAYVGALSIALGTMVGNFTVGKKKYADNEPHIIELMAEAETVKNELIALIDEDAKAFEPLSKAYAIPKGEPGRDEIMEKCLRDAADVPLKIMKLCCRSIMLQKEFAEKGSTLMVSDAGTGAVLAWGAMYGAALNVKVNTKLMTDREYADGINAQVDDLLNTYWKIADGIYESVMARFN